ncbi:hypothetical protein FOA52_002337 [Chlamydomonas sp. UWO 241]|nr:hypothetical protein FOA52_002337 [Chlamydomonas sp. UWO 241]
MCGSPMTLSTTGDTQGSKPDWRHICSSPAGCGYIDYLNPKIVVGCIVEHNGKILLARRGIEPCKGKWTVPAGFMELNESTAEGATRETMEEANAHVHLGAPYVHWDIPAIGQ